MSSKKTGKTLSLIIAIIFLVLSMGNIFLRVSACTQLEKPIILPTEHSSEEEQAVWITYKKFCRNPVPYVIFILALWYLTSALNKLRSEN
ncbi:MAG: hypothetical protein UT53_C0008G0001 [Candidatus Yanofskybacteria bacterium GW2011_GWD2_39_48]|uniref:Uncharacterized protein n=1 Tax=Candidatus Yanofskybacteria bacterium GW2011_GWD2_39_48 TaxID=1619031 RepID=A0A0G0PF01_9BACT|nr:MAG: hypothetical protein UT53_C0008G0001 [Candidatus Yanofskybacteria bacterium GW2011_GWD2_39_48]